MSRHFVLAAGGTGGHMVPGRRARRRADARVATASPSSPTRAACASRDCSTVSRRMSCPPVAARSRRPQGWASAAREIRRGRRDGARAVPHVPARRGDRLRRLSRAFRRCSRRSRTWKSQHAVHEQNAVLGRVNRLLAGRVSAIATAYPDVERLKPALADKVHLVGNPVRDTVLALRDQPVPAAGGGRHASACSSPAAARARAC